MLLVSLDHLKFTSQILFSDALIKIIIKPSGLTKEQEEKVYNCLAPIVQTFMTSHDYSSDVWKGLKALIEFMEEAYEVALKAVNMSSLVIIVDCPTLRGLEHLWNDYLSGHLNEAVERYLVTDEIKKKLGLDTVNLKATIDAENYLTCRKFLMEMPGAYSCIHVNI